MPDCNVKSNINNLLSLAKYKFLVVIKTTRTWVSLKKILSNALLLQNNLEVISISNYFQNTPIVNIFSMHTWIKSL